MSSTISVSPETLTRVLQRMCGADPNSSSASERDLQVAIRQAKKRVNLDPNDHHFQTVLAAWECLDDEPQLAMERLRPFLGSAEASADTLTIAGYASVQSDQYEQARQMFDRVVKLDPHRCECWTMLGRIASHAEQSDWAIEFHKRAIAFGDDCSESAIELSGIYVRHKRLDDAIHMLRVTLLRQRNHPKLNRTLARLLRKRSILLGRQGKRVARQRITEERLQCLRSANGAAPRPDSYVRQGRIEARLERYDEARRSFEQAVRLAPDCATSLAHLANANVDRGELSLAIEQFEAAIRIAPEHSATHFKYSRAKKFSDNAATRDYIAKLQSILSQDSLSLRSQVHLRFALAKVFDDLKQYDLAWKNYDLANCLKPGHTEHQSSDNQAEARPKKPRPKSETKPLKRIAEGAIRFFNQDLFAANPNTGVRRDEVAPIFVVGMPRSGTTLTEQILTSHPEIAGAGELKSINNIRRGIEHEIRNRARKSSTKPCAYPESLMQMDRHRLQTFANEYLNELNTFRTHERLVTDKMPTNFMHLGLIALMFPDAKVIHCRRDPLDVLVSCYCQNLNPPFCDLNALAYYYRQYQQMMDHFERTLPIKIHHISYEETVVDCERVARGMIDHCGLSWDPACIKFHQNRRSVHTPSKWQVRQPMYTSSVQKWKRFETHLQPIMEELYETQVSN
ncbi:tetratricopeptide repeat-containing sulfotransferase family protein [Rubripirellula reticaptiva]|uniref:Tetratricopeptide repeat protein n=1 Tax=Rubripirellula reticaptiva TaxID=2528013 RepID=A0A5C6F5D0_9BACT|nr:sulfotransferase [Rubripirellula reticaptiva]TWU55059.1 Tetratricopeptide repeat protein [Rubripirellula reticaptiva]